MRLIYEDNHEPKIGRFKNAIVEDQIAELLWIYDCAGSHTPVSTAGRSVFSFPVKANFPAIGKASVIYIDLSTGFTYAWDGTTYKLVGDGIEVLNTISVKDYGAKGNGTTDDTQAIKNAFDAANTAGKALFFPKGNYVSGALYKAFMPKVWAFPGTVTILATNTTDTTWNFGVTSYGNAVNLTSDALKNSTVLQVPTTGFNANDLIVVQTNTADNGTPYAQTVRIYSIDSSTQMTLAEPLYQDFLTSASAKIRALPANQNGGFVRGFKFKNAATNPATSTGAFLRFFYGSNIDVDVEGEGAGNPGVTMEGCYQFRVKHIANRYYDQTITGLLQFGYGVNISGASAHGEVNVIADQVRHAVSFNGTPNDIRITGEAHACTSTAWDAHQGGVNIVFDNCQAFGSRGFGFALRGKRQHVHGGLVDQCYGGVFIFDSPGENEIKGLRVSNLRDSGNGNDGNGIVVSKTMASLTIDDCDFYNIPRSAISLRAGTISDLFITNNRALNVGLSNVANERNFIRQLSASSAVRARIFGNVVGDNQGSPSLQYGIQLAGTTNSDISIWNNAFHNISAANVFNGTGISVSHISRNFINNQMVDRITDVTFSTTPTFDASMSAIQRITLTGNATSSTISNPTDGQVLQLIIAQDATGGRSFAWPSNVVWQGSAPTLNTSANAYNIFSFTYIASIDKWISIVQGSGTDPTAIHTTGDETATGTKTFSTKLLVGNVGDPQGGNVIDIDGSMGIIKKSADQNPAGISLYKRGTTSDNTAAVANAAGIGGINGYGWHGTGYTRQVDIDFIATENWSSTARGTRIDGFVTSNGTTSRVQAFRFDQDKSLTVYEKIQPNTNASYSLGTSTSRWTTLWTSNVSTNLRTVTADTSINALTDGTLLINAASNNVTATLPTAVNNLGKMLTIKRIDNSGNTVSVATTSAQTIDGSATYSLSAQWKYVKVQSDGANWVIIGNN